MGKTSLGLKTTQLINGLWKTDGDVENEMAFPRCRQNDDEYVGRKECSVDSRLAVLTTIMCCKPLERIIGTPYTYCRVDVMNAKICNHYEIWRV